MVVRLFVASARQCFHFILLLVHSWNTGDEPELISVLHTNCSNAAYIAVLNAIYLQLELTTYAFTHAKATSHRCALSARRTEPTAYMGGGRNQKW